jgi:hypothetical protein
LLKRVLLLPAVLGLVAAACGGIDDSAVASVDDIEGSPTATVASISDEEDEGNINGEVEDGASEEVTTEQALLDLAACMRDEGVDVDDPQIDADGNFRLGAIIRQASNADPDQIREALDACSEYLEGVTLGFRDFDLTELQDQMLEFAMCMRDNGYDMPDPDFSNFGPRGTGQGGEGVGEGPFGEIDTRDPQYRAAFDMCQDTLSFGRFGGGGGEGRGGGSG